MIPSKRNVLDLTDCYLREIAAGAWSRKHTLATVQEQHLHRGRGTVTAKSTRQAPGHRVLSPALSRDGRFADQMLAQLGTLDNQKIMCWKLERAVNRQPGHRPGTCKAS